VPSAPSPAELLADLTAALTPLALRWYVFGAQAALIWGRPRLTTDVDVTIQLGSVAPERLVAALETRRFARRLQMTDAFVNQTRVLPLVHEPTGLALDIVLAGPGLEELFLSRAVHVDVAGVEVPFISPEDLIVTKILAGRSKDIEDVRGVLAERGDRLRVNDIEQVLAMVEDALGQSDLRPVFQSELARWRARSR
jgi:hypothetical protein